MRDDSFLVQDTGKITTEEKQNCKNAVKSYLNSSADEPIAIQSDVRQIKFCFKLLKHAYNNEKEEKIKYRKSKEQANEELTQYYLDVISEKEKTICILFS